MDGAKSLSISPITGNMVDKSDKKKDGKKKRSLETKEKDGQTSKRLKKSDDGDETVEVEATMPIGMRIRLQQEKQVAKKPTVEEKKKGLALGPLCSRPNILYNIGSNAFRVID